MTDTIPDPKEKTQDGQAGTGGAASRDGTRTRNTQDSSYQNYLFGGAGSSDAPAWSDTIKGRMLMRLVSRGIVGATFFVVGSRMAAKQMAGYKIDAKPTAPLQYVAKGIDLTLGKGIQKTVEGFARLAGKPNAEALGKAAVTFRESRKFGSQYGRSYGSDIVNFTFDFAMASTGDALTRNIIAAFDPNVKQTWKLNDQGEMAKKGEHWHFVPSEFLKWTGKTAWRIFSKNQGEDWAAAIPYAFQMKWQRSFLNKAFNKRWEGHELVFDRGWNGGAWKINQQGKIVGDYQLVGGLDLHARFVGYNWYTLMFREGYDALGRKWEAWKEHGFSSSYLIPDHLNPIRGTIDTARYVTKSFIKANMYMNPAVMFFWPMRVAQSRWRGKFHVEDGMKEFDANTAKRTHIWEKDGMDPYAWSHYEYYKTDSRFDRVEKNLSKYILTPMGWCSFKVGSKAADAAEWLHNNKLTPRSKWVENLLQDDKGRLLQGGRRFAHEVVDASFSYTPYMYAKQEFGLRVDDTKGDGKLGQMDIAIYKFMDDVAGLKFKEIPADLKKMWKLGANFEREIKVREGGAPDAQQTAKAPEPKTTVHASTAQHHTPADLNRTQPEANDEQHERNWVKMVAGSDINPAHIHTGNHTRH